MEAYEKASQRAEEPWVRGGEGWNDFGIPRL